MFLMDSIRLIPLIDSFDNSKIMCVCLQGKTGKIRKRLFYCLSRNESNRNQFCEMMIKN